MKLALEKDTFLESQKTIDAIIQNVNKVIIGKQEAVELIVLALICQGHVLIEDVPGVGKTSIVSALAKSVSCEFKRIQFTPDIMPSDITGFSIFNQKSGEFEFRPGAAMSNFVLADEINRASAKTQSALLEIMEEHQVTVDSNTYELEEPFMVLATQNPVDYMGTYPLPEAQIDRFLMKVSLGYPSIEDEISVLGICKQDKKDLSPVATGEDICAVAEETDNVYVDPLIKRYIVQIVNATRTHSDIALGCSPRGSLALQHISKAYALYCGRDYVIPDDVKHMAPHVLPHRLILNYEAKVEKKTGLDIIEDVLKKIAVPILSKV